MDFKAEMVKRVSKEINEVMAYRGKTFDEAVEIVRWNTVAGPAVWDIVLTSKEKQS